MTNEFKKAMEKAMEHGILVARKQDEEYLEKARQNQKYADLYMELVLAYVEQFDFRSGQFQDDKVNKDILKKFGQPKSVTGWISKNGELKGTIALNYGDKNNGWLREGEPEFKKDEEFDLKIINEILSENGISIREDYVDGGGYGSQNDYIYFDASMLIEMQNKLLEESPSHHIRR